MMPRMKSFFGLLLCAAAASAAGPELTAFLPADATVVMGARLRGLLDSDLMRNGAGQSLAADPQWRKLAETFGFDPFHDVDEIVVAANGTGDNPPFVMAARGRFKMAAAALATATYRGVPMVDMGSGSALALIDAETVLVGDAAEVRAAIERGQGPADAASRASSLSAKYDMWGFGKKPAGFVPSNAAPDGLAGVDNFEFGILWSRGLELTTELHLSDIKAATDLVKGAAQLEALLKMQQPSANALHLDSHLDGDTLRFAVSIPEEELKKAVASRNGAGWKPTVAVKAAAAPIKMSTPAPAPAPVAKPPARPEARPLVISVPLAPSSTGDATSVFRLPGN
jgi:hypothetical protein